MFIQIKEHPRYEIDENSIIKNIKNSNIKSQYVGSTGYYMVSFSYNNQSKPQRVHRLLATTFIDNPQKLPCVNHLDGDKLNNSIINLEWCTHAENMKHAFATGLANNTGVKNGKSKLTHNKVLEIKKYLASGFSQQKIANTFSVSRSCIQGISNGRLWKHV